MKFKPSDWYWCVLPSICLTFFVIAICRGIQGERERKEYWKFLELEEEKFNHQFAEVVSLEGQKMNKLYEMIVAENEKIIERIKKISAIHFTTNELQLEWRKDLIEHYTKECNYANTQKEDTGKRNELLKETAYELRGKDILLSPCPSYYESSYGGGDDSGDINDPYNW